MAAVLAGLGQLLGSGPALAAPQKKKGGDQELTIDAVVESLWAVSGPVLTNLGFSGCMGWAAGMALKKVGQVLAVLVGVAFAALQGLAYAGFITVNWTHVQGTINSVLDVNKDGKVDQKDFKHVTSKGLGVLAQGVPSIGGFLAGFAMGIRS